MDACREVACFRSDDDPRLVAASLACPVCLGSNVDWTLENWDWEARAECACRPCGHSWSVGLRPDQALRLSLDGGRRPVEA